MNLLALQYRTVPAPQQILECSSIISIISKQKAFLDLPIEEGAETLPLGASPPHSADDACMWSRNWSTWQERRVARLRPPSTLLSRLPAVYGAEPASPSGPLKFLSCWLRVQCRTLLECDKSHLA
nr:hypothetical protein CFP56_01294 [Quercus suber]